jgi:hypothetical protein
MVVNMTQDKVTELLERIFAVNEQVVRQNHQIMSVLTNPRITKAQGWQDLTDKEVETIRANSQNAEWAILMAQSTLKEKNT